MNDGKIACRCHGVTYGRIREALRRGARTPEEVAAATGAGTACGSCKEFLACLVRDFAAEEEKER